MAELRGKGVLFGTVVAVVLALGAAPADAQRRKKKAPAKPAAKIDVPAESTRLSAADVAVASAAAAKLGQTRDGRAVEALLDALAIGLHPKVAAAALDALAQHQAPKAFEVSAHYLNHRDRRVRSAAVRAVGSINDSRAVAMLLASLRDSQKDVRAAAVAVVGSRKLKRGIEPMMELLKRGDEAPADALAEMADADLAMLLGELIGEAPDAVLARTFGLILLRPDFKPEAARVQVVRTLGKIPGTEAVEQLTSYIEKIPEKPPRQSRREAEQLIEARLTGGN